MFAVCAKEATETGWFISLSKRAVFMMILFQIFSACALEIRWWGKRGAVSGLNTQSFNWRELVVVSIVTESNSFARVKVSIEVWFVWWAMATFNCLNDFRSFRIFCLSVSDWTRIEVLWPCMILKVVDKDRNVCLIVVAWKSLGLQTKTLVPLC